MALNDLVNAISYPRYAPADCARAIESIRAAITPDERNRKKAWKQMRIQLNLSRDYTDFITELSTGPRHGDWKFIPEAQTMGSIERSWKILDRFIAYVRGGKKQLPSDQFPQL